MAYITPHDWTSEQATVALMDEISDNFRALFPVGFYAYICRAATTVETLLDNCWLECNAVSVLRATYPDLNTLLSGLGYPFGTVDGTHMTLPPAEGRGMISQASGGHADVNALGDSDGLAKASRTPKDAAHAHTGSSHTHGAGTLIVSTAPVTVADGAAHSVAVNGSYGVSGTSGSGGTGSTSSAGANSGAYLVGGVWFIKAVA